VALTTLVLGMLGLLLMWAGGGWDVAWHRTFGRDTFWSPPHLLLYTGVALSGVAAVIETVRAVSGQAGGRRELRFGPLRCELGLALVGIGAAGSIASAPIDDAWHAAFGRDVDIWSPPHLLAVACVALIYAGWAIALAPGAAPVADRVLGALRLLVLGSLCGAAVFVLNFYYMMASTREAFFYPLALAVTVPFVLGFGAHLLGGRWPATRIAAAFTALGLLAIVLLTLRGMHEPAFPPLVIAGAIAIDVARRQTSRPLVIGVAFAVAFVLAELVRTSLVSAGAAVAPIEATTAARDGLYLQYRAAAIARPWLSLWPLAAVLVAGPIAALTFSVGGTVARALTRVPSRREPELQPIAYLQHAGALQPRDP